MARNAHALIVQRLVCKNFRCFSHLEIDLNSPLIVCEDANGAGKTSLLEALYYAGNLRSFRTHLPREMTQFGKENFFIKLFLEEQYDNSSFSHEIQVGFARGKRLVRINQQQITSHRELINHYRVISITEDDLALVKGAPECRRDFLDSIIALYDPEYRPLMRMFRHLLHQRNAFLAQRVSDINLYTVLSTQLLTLSCKIQQYRQTCLERLNNYLAAIMVQDFSNYHLSLTYELKRAIPLDYFTSSDTRSLFHDEVRVGRSLWGAHLDDFSIFFNQRLSRSFSSRGQQKLIVILLKIAQMQELIVHYGKVILLLDDFATDLDEATLLISINRLMVGNNQLIFTCPTSNTRFSTYLRSQGAKLISIAS